MSGEDFSAVESDGFHGTGGGIAAVESVDESIVVGDVEDVDLVAGGGVEEGVAEGEGGDDTEGGEGGEGVVVEREEWWGGGGGGEEVGL